MISESHTASIDYRATVVVQSFICECDVALEHYRSWGLDFQHTTQKIDEPLFDFVEWLFVRARTNRILAICAAYNNMIVT